MFTGILRWKGARESGSIWWILYTQGLAWVVIFTLAEVPPVVLITLNLNCVYLSYIIPWLRTNEDVASEDPMSRMFIAPGVTIMSIGASRIYLGLINSATLNNHPVGAGDFKKRATETPIRFPAPLPQTYLTDDTSRSTHLERLDE
ncbi:hypothetical protein BJV74DRAFT_882929 [Russula compacta]|nr:hypothetical protein BJV74DRAFT_882929 [Russula compacta]